MDDSDARAWARLHQDRVIKDLRQGEGQSFLLPATQGLMSRRKHVDSKKLLDNGLWLHTFSQIAAAAQRLAIVEGG